MTYSPHTSYRKPTNPNPIVEWARRDLDTATAAIAGTITLALLVAAIIMGGM